jgi:hypothetical protein
MLADRTWQLNKLAAKESAKWQREHGGEKSCPAVDPPGLRSTIDANGVLWFEADIDPPKNEVALEAYYGRFKELKAEAAKPTGLRKVANDVGDAFDTGMKWACSNLSPCKGAVERRDYWMERGLSKGDAILLATPGLLMDLPFGSVMGTTKVVGPPPPPPRRFKVPIPKLSGKDGAKDVPGWAKGNRPFEGESGKDFAKRLLDEKYGPQDHPTGPGSEFNQLKKWGDRAFENPPPLPPSTK